MKMQVFNEARDAIERVTNDAFDAFSPNRNSVKDTPSSE